MEKMVQVQMHLLVLLAQLAQLAQLVQLVQLVQQDQLDLQVQLVGLEQQVVLA